MEYTNFDPHQNAIQDMLGRPPGWLLHSGMTMIAVVVAIVIGLCAFVSYPDKVEVGFTLQTETVPLPIVPDRPAYIDSIFVAEGVAVASGDTLAVFRSDANWRALGSLENWIEARRLSGTLRPVAPPKAEYPTTVGAGVGRLTTTANAWSSYLANNGTAAQIDLYAREISETERLNAALERQLSLYDDEIGLLDKQFERDRFLEEEQLVSTKEMETTNRSVINAERQRESLAAGLIRNRINIEQLRQRSLASRLEDRERQDDLERTYVEDLLNLETLLTDYRNRYIITARESGRVTWDQRARKGALVTAADPLGYLLPASGGRDIVARCTLTGSEVGRVGVGDEVLLSLDAYPYREYGRLRGYVSHIAPIATPDAAGGYRLLATVALENGVTTTYGRTLTFRQNLTGSAKVIIAKRSLLDRFVDQFLHLKNS